jgi:hypothetical protein
LQNKGNQIALGYAHAARKWQGIRGT